MTKPRARQELGQTVPPLVWPRLTGPIYHGVWLHGGEVSMGHLDRSRYGAGGVGSPAFAATATFAEQRQVSLRKAAFAIGIERVAKAVKLRGHV